MTPTLCVALLLFDRFDAPRRAARNCRVMESQHCGEPARVDWQRWTTSCGRSWLVNQLQRATTVRGRAALLPHIMMPDASIRRLARNKQAVELSLVDSRGAQWSQFEGENTRLGPTAALDLTSIPPLASRARGPRPRATAAFLHRAKFEGIPGCLGAITAGWSRPEPS